MVSKRSSHTRAFLLLTRACSQGASGAGKTTLLDVLANKKTGGKIGGTIVRARSPSR
jgi:hypothetical protein